FLQGVTGLPGDAQLIDAKTLSLTIIIVLYCYGFMKLPRIGHYSFVFTIVFGCILFYRFGLAKLVVNVSDHFKLPDIFAFGTPRLEMNMVIMVILITFLLLANMLATVKVVQQVFAQEKVPFETNRLKQTGVISGINQLLGGFFSAI